MVCCGLAGTRKDAKYLFTLVVALDPEEAGGEAQHGELVQLGDDVLVEGQLHGEVVQLRIEALAMALARVALLRSVVRRFRSVTNKHLSQLLILRISTEFCLYFRRCGVET